jgi:katanin p80 WD40 repeat-containing subunit B1
MLFILSSRHISLALEMLFKLLKAFGDMIYSTVTASTSVGVDLHAEGR